MSRDADNVRLAVVLVSGGLDSATVLAHAIAEGWDCHALSFDYGQRHRAELDAAICVARMLGASSQRRIRIDFGAIGGSALTDPAIAVPERAVGEILKSNVIPSTYVPARNTVFLAMALSYAEVIGARDLFIGVNAVDYSGYPDCRPVFIQAFEHLAQVATRAGIEGGHFEVHAPLMQMNKAEIIRCGMRLGVDYSRTVSCYQADVTGAACGRCDACHLRRKGFEGAGVPDPTRYVPDASNR